LDGGQKALLKGEVSKAIIKKKNQDPLGESGDSSLSPNLYAGETKSLKFCGDKSGSISVLCTAQKST
jgi:hypothetical protein